MSTTNERVAMEAQVIKKSLKDPAFRKSLIEDPKGTLEKEYGIKLPADLKINVYPEAKNTINLVLPAVQDADADLTDGHISGSVADCSGWVSAGECAAECTQCGNNDTSCQPGPTEE